MKPLLTKQDAASYVAMSERWVQRHRSELGGYLVGGRLRFKQADVDAYLERNKLVRSSRRPRGGE